VNSHLSFFVVVISLVFVFLFFGDVVLLSSLESFLIILSLSFLAFGV